MRMNYENIDLKLTAISRQYPNHTAIKQGKRLVTYRELEERSNAIANFFYGQLGDSKRVMVVLDRSPELIEIILGLFKCGGIFVPIDPNYPGHWVEQLFRETGGKWLITMGKYLEKFKETIEQLSLKVFLVDGEARCHIDVQKGKNILEFERDTYKYCYIYFTSGSTGEPKGVLGRHRSLTHFIEWEIREFQVDETFKVSQLINPSFDPFLRDIFVPLAVGATSCIPESYQVLMDPLQLIEWIDQEKINLMHIVPSLFKTLVSEIKDANCFNGLKYILLAGELLRGNDIKKFIEIFKNKIQLANLYGPTETTLAKLFYRINQEDANRAIIPVGKPIDDTQVMILDDKMQKCLDGNIGEVYIRTPFISSGYFNNRELNKKVFIKNPYTNNPQDIIYKSGDLGKVLPDGNIELSDRVDQQVKIRGARVEMGKIESELLKYDHVKEAVLIGKEAPDGEKCLCAYIVSNAKISSSELREYLSKRLPAYMVPSLFIFPEQIPLTPNGKIDRRSLPEPEIKAEDGYIAPRNELDKILVEIWSEVLGIEKGIIGIDSSFFDLGGHSLKAITITARIHRKFSIRLPLVDFFKTSTIRELACYIESKAGDSFTAIVPGAKKEYYPLSLTQKRFYILMKLEPDNISYNLPQVFLLEGHCSLSRLEKVFRDMISRHQSLRTSFAMVGGEPIQRLHDEVNLSIENYESTEEELDQKLRSLIRPFDLSRAPLIRVALIKVGEAKYVLNVEMHHIITDGISINILENEFVALMAGKELPPLKLQYTDFSEWQNSERQRENIEKQGESWYRKFEDGVPQLNLPLDFSRPKVQGFKGSTLFFYILTDVTKELKKMALAEETSLYMLLFSLYYILLWKITGQEDLVIGTAVSGRRHDDLMNIIGLFFNTLPIRYHLTGNKTFKEFLTGFKENTLLAFENQDYPLDKLVEDLVVRKKITLKGNRSTLFDTMFSMQNFDTQAYTIKTMELPGLKIIPHRLDFQTSRFNLFFITTEFNDTISVSLQYDTALFKTSTMEKLKKHYVEIIQQVVNNKEIELGTIKISSEFQEVDTGVDQQEFRNFGFYKENEPQNLNH